MHAILTHMTRRIHVRPDSLQEQFDNLLLHTYTHTHTHTHKERYIDLDRDRSSLERERV